VPIRGKPRIAERFRRLACRRRYRLDTRAEDLDVEGAGEQRERDDRPPDAGEKRAAAGERAERGADAEVEEKELDQRRRVAEQLDIAL
jgi:hypothetical protein